MTRLVIKEERSRASLIIEDSDQLSSNEAHRKDSSKFYFLMRNYLSSPRF